MKKAQRITTPRLMLRTFMGEPRYGRHVNGISQLTILRRYRARRRRLLKITKASRKRNRR
jgi:hypothetical protein